MKKNASCLSHGTTAFTPRLYEHSFYSKALTHLVYSLRPPHSMLRHQCERQLEREVWRRNFARCLRCFWVAEQPNITCTLTSRLKRMRRGGASFWKWCHKTRWRMRSSNEYLMFFLQVKEDYCHLSSETSSSELNVTTSNRTRTWWILSDPASLSHSYLTWLLCYLIRVFDWSSYTHTSIWWR